VGTGHWVQRRCPSALVSNGCRVDFWQATRPQFIPMQVPAVACERMKYFSQRFLAAEALIDVRLRSDFPA
jgi:hypothetical protein